MTDASPAAWCPDPIAQRWWDGTGWTDHTRLDGEPGEAGPVANLSGQPAPGWYADPMAERWWDGTGWTTQTRVNWPPVAAVAGQAANPTMASASASTAGRPRRRVLLTIAAVAAIVGVLAAVVVVVTVRQNNTEAAPSSAPRSTTAPADTLPVAVAPAGALPVDAAGGVVQAADLATSTISIASCPGLLAAVPATSCTEMETDDGTFALTLTALGEGVEVVGYQLVTEGSGITAIAQVSGTVAVPQAPGASLVVEAFRIPVSSGDVLGLVATLSSEEAESSTVELFATDTGRLAPAAVLRGDRAELAADEATIAVVFLRDPQNRRYTTLYPVDGGWMSVSEVLDASVARDRIDAAAQVEQVVEIVLETDPAPLDTQPADSLPVAGEDGLGAVGTIIDGYFVPCEGAWITIVGSRPYEQVAAALAANPGSRAVRNRDACPSLNPTFSSGSSAGQDIYVVFYGPFALLDEAQGTCNQLGFTSINNCFVAPLTFNEADRSVRYGPL